MADMQSRLAAAQQQAAQSDAARSRIAVLGVLGTIFAGARGTRLAQPDCIDE